MFADFDRLVVFCPSTAPATPTLKALMNELKSVQNWRTLGVNLELSYVLLKTIERNHHGDNERCKFETLTDWLDNTTNPTWDAVVEALYLMDEHRVAEEIRRKYITFTTTTEGNCLYCTSVQFMHFISSLRCKLANFSWILECCILQWSSTVDSYISVVQY